MKPVWKIFSKQRELYFRQIERKSLEYIYIKKILLFLWVGGHHVILIQLIF